MCYLHTGRLTTPKHKAGDITVVYQIIDYSTNWQYAQEKQREGYTIKAMVFRA